jgi:hypothetical protein
MKKNLCLILFFVIFFIYPLNYSNAGDFLKSNYLNVENTQNLKIVDWNKDGRPDLFSGENIYLNNGSLSNPDFNEGNKVMGDVLTKWNIGIPTDWNNDNTYDKLGIKIKENNRYPTICLNMGTDDSPQFTQETIINANGSEIVLSYTSWNYFTKDFNQDKLFDLILSSNSGETRIYLNVGSAGSPEFSSYIDIKLNPQGSIITDIADWDNNGTMDLIGTKNGFFIFLNENVLADSMPDTLTFNGNQIIVPESLLSPESLIRTLVYDWNNDEKKDVIFGYSQGYIDISINEGTDSNPIFYSTSALPSSSYYNIDAGRYSSPVAVDWNEDGKTDVIIGNNYDTMLLCLNTTDNTRPIFGFISNINVNGSPIYGSFPQIFDWNMDGNKDLYVSNKLYINVGSNQAPIFNKSKSILPSNIYRSCFPIDWDNDSLNDFVCSTYEFSSYKGQLLLLLNTATNDNPIFESNPIMVNDTPITGKDIQPLIIDLDRDGRKDLVWVDSLRNIMFSSNINKDEDPYFISTENVKDLSGYPKISIYDFDLDGDNDMLVGRDEGVVELWRNAFSNVEKGNDTEYIAVYSGYPGGWSSGSNESYWQFSPVEDIFVTALGIWQFPYSLQIDSQYDVKITSEDSSTVVSGTVIENGYVVDDFRFASVNPVKLYANKSYTISSFCKNRISFGSNAKVNPYVELLDNNGLGPNFLFVPINSENNTENEFPIINFNEISKTIFEYTGVLEINSYLTIPYENDVIVQYSFSGSATGNGVDYEIKNKTIIIPAGNVKSSLSITIINDKMIEEDEMLIITMESVKNAIIGNNLSYTCSIIDDDEFNIISAKGNIDNDTIWDGQLIHVTGDLTVDNGVTLTIVNGTILEFQNNYGIYVHGTLIATGSENVPITFIAKSSSIGWNGIIFDDTPIENDMSKIENCFITNVNSEKGAIFLNNMSNIEISDNLIRNNRVKHWGAIFCNNNSNPIINNNIIYDNYCSGIYIVGSSPTIISNLLANNANVDGGGISIWDSSNPTIINNIIANNYAQYGAAFTIYNKSNATIINNTIVNNYALHGSGVNAGNIVIFFYNTIFWGNTYRNEKIQNISGPVVLYNCLIQSEASKYSGNNNIDTDPMFVSPSGECGKQSDGVEADWSLQESSPCINAGYTQANDLLIYPNDFAGKSRIRDGIIDIGAYEYQEGNHFPIITDIQPKSDVILGGAIITIKGTNLGNSNGQVFFGNSLSLTITTWGDNQIVCIAPPNNEGVVNIEIQTENKLKAIKSSAFKYLLPSITEIAPKFDSITGGSYVSITGTFFGPNQGNGQVYFGDSLSLTIVSWQNDNIICIAPPNNPETIDIEISTSTSLIAKKTKSFTYVNIEDGLIAYYPFKGDAKDDSGNKNNSVLNNASFIEDRFGIVNSALLVNGDESYVSIPEDLIPNDNSDFSISLWFNHENEDNEFRYLFVLERLYPPITPYLRLYIRNNKIVGDIYTGSSWRGFGATSNISKNTWYFFVFTKKNNQIHLYCFDRLESDISSSFYQFNDDITIRVGGRGYNGIIDDLRIYNRAMNSSEVKYLYQKESKINKKTQQIDFTTIDSKVYGDLPFSISASASSGLTIIYNNLTPDIISINENTITITKPGIAKIQALQPGDLLYEMAPTVEMSFTINKKLLIYTADNKDKLCHNENPQLSYIVTGFVSDENENDLEKKPTISTNATINSPSGEYSIHFSEGLDSRYRFSYINGTLTVKKINTVLDVLTISDKIYGDKPFKIDFSSNSNVPVKIVNLTPQTIGVNEYTITILNSGIGSIQAIQNSNECYKMAIPVEKSFTINKKQLFIIAENKQRYFSSENPQLTYLFQGFVNAEDKSDLDMLPEISTIATVDSPSGDYPIILKGGFDNNYEYVYVHGTLKILPIDLSLYFDTIADKTYGDKPFTVNAYSNRDTEIILTNLTPETIELHGITVTILKSGSASIKASVEKDNNYETSNMSIDKTFEIKKAPLNVKAEDMKRQYGNPNPDFILQYQGFLNQDNEQSIDKLPEIKCDASAYSKPGNYEIIPLNAIDDCYNFNYQAGSLEVIDEIVPEISEFKVMENAASISITNKRYFSVLLNATDNTGTIYKWYISENPETPELSVLESASSKPITEYTIQSSGDGFKSLYAWVMDNSSNISSSKQYTILLDTTAELVIQDTYFCISESSFSLSGLMENIANIDVFSQTLTIEKIEYPTDTSWQVELASISPGNHNIEISLTDLAGNTRSETITINRSIPKTTHIIKDATTLIANAQNSMNLTIVIQDHEQNSICVDMDITVSTSLGSIDHNHIKTENGQAIVSFIASDTLGMAKIEVWHQAQLLAEDTVEMIAGPPKQLSFITPAQEILVDDDSALIKIQIQDDLGHPATIKDRLRILLSSTSKQSGQFWSWIGSGYSWMDNESIALVTQDNNPFLIKYKGSEPGVYTITASDTSGFLASDSQVITVMDQPYIQFRLENSETLESKQIANVELKLNRATEEDIWIEYITETDTENTATEGLDYEISPELEVIILAGEVSGFIPLTIINDQIYELKELVTIKLVDSSISIGSKNVHTLLIIDDESPPSPPEITGPTSPTHIKSPEWCWISGGGSQTFRYKIDDPDLSLGSVETKSKCYQHSSELAEGDHIFYLQEFNAPTNEWSTTGMYRLEIDTGRPCSKAQSPPGIDAQHMQFEITYTYADIYSGEICGNPQNTGSGLKHIELWGMTPENQAYTLLTKDSDALIDGKFNYTATSDGPYRFFTRAIDQAGNIEPESGQEYDTETIYSKNFSGYAIMAVGAIDEQKGLPSHTYTANKIYRHLISRKFGMLYELNDPLDHIKYFNPYHTELLGVDPFETHQKYPEALESSITQWALNNICQLSGPLYIILINHGATDTFYLSGTNDRLDASVLDEWITTLEDGIQECTDDPLPHIIIVMDTCYSGSFMNDLIKPGSSRIIITSTTENEVSFRGPKTLSNGLIRDGAFFISNLFNELSRGVNLAESFERAVVQTEILSGRHSISPKYPFYDNALQHPLLDDNGSGKGHNTLYSFGGDGYRAKQVTLGFGLHSTNEPDIIQTIFQPASALDPNENSLDISVAVNSPDNLKVFIEIKTPNDNHPKTVIEQLQKELDLKQINLTYDDMTGQYQVTCNEFHSPGKYTLFFYLQDSDGIMYYADQSFVFKEKENNNPPNPFQLIQPINLDDSEYQGFEEKISSRVIFQWEDTFDPERDSFTYTLLISKSRHFDTDVIKHENMIASQDLKEFPESWDGCDVYWKVQAIDAFGAYVETDVSRFTLDDTNTTEPPIVYLHVYDSQTRLPIPGAKICFGKGDKQLEIKSSKYGHLIQKLDFSLPIDVTITAKTYDTAYTQIYNADTIISLDIALVSNVQMGDINRDSRINMGDAILCLQILSGCHVSDFFNGQGAFVYDDLSLVDIIYVLRSVSGRLDHVNDLF